MTPAEPSHCQWVFVIVVVGIDLFGAADLAGCSDQITGLERPLHGQMSRILAGEATTPPRLSCGAGQGHFPPPIASFAMSVAETFPGT